MGGFVLYRESLTLFAQFFQHTKNKEVDSETDKWPVSTIRKRTTWQFYILIPINFLKMLIQFIAKI